QMSSGPETGAAQRPPDSGSPASRIQKFMQYFTEPEPEPETGTGVTPEPAGKLTSFFTEPDSDEIPAGVTRETHAPLQASTETHLDSASQPEPVPPGADAGQPADGKAVTPSFVQRIRSLFVSPVQKDIQTLDFDPGELGTPSLEGSLRDVNITYPIDPPYQFIHIEYSKKDGALIYNVVEPQLSEDEKVALDIVERAFEKLVSTNLEIIEGDRRTEYLRERFYSLVNIFGLKLSEHQKERMFFTLKRQYLGYSRIDSLMKDKYIEDISCNGSDIFLYVQ